MQNDIVVLPIPSVLSEVRNVSEVFYEELALNLITFMPLELFFQIAPLISKALRKNITSFIASKSNNQLTCCLLERITNFECREVVCYVIDMVP